MTRPEDRQEQYVAKQIKAAQAGEYPEHKEINEAENGSMVNDMEDLIQLGEDMEAMKTSQEDLEQNGLLSDPEQ
ncbi:MAG: hypothetical protein KZY74_14480 [Paenibacillaceae bacterium]|uniref:Uncharacterized protein n=1 Tax=Paenibacillus mellifer TaxID=2937794 RepID=A0A9X2BNS5_9BACL|nr:hypothetical protein [Paenibacillus mellifer]MBW4840596.1 hypothetical protein [Paenibacillaceae bacterium]MCK8487189.1 hypothetical protein [Paenibacillus mellifer]